MFLATCTKVVFIFIEISFMFSCLGTDLNEEQRSPFSILQRLLLLKSLRNQSNQVRFLQSERCTKRKLAEKFI